jgi:hypothetical protein
MPYDPENPPEKLRGLSPTKQRQWVHVFNSCFEKNGDDALCSKEAWGVTGGWQDKDVKTKGADMRNSVEVSFRVKGDAVREMPKLIEYIMRNGASGHSFPIVVDAGDSERQRTFSFDGDGSDYIDDLKVDGVKFETDKEYKGMNLDILAENLIDDEVVVEKSIIPDLMNTVMSDKLGFDVEVKGLDIQENE